MPRTATAIIDTEPTSKAKTSYLSEQYQADVEAQVWGCVNELWRLGRQHREITPSIEPEEAKLIDMQRWQHKYPHAPDVEERWAVYRIRSERQADRKAELASINARAKQCCANLAKHWDRLKPARQKAFRQHDGWSKSASGSRIAAELWDYAQRGLPHPDGEKGF